MRHHFPATPFIVISGVPAPDNVRADAFFAKGRFRLEELLEKISELLHRGPDRSRAIPLDIACKREYEEDGSGHHNLDKAARDSCR